MLKTSCTLHFNILPQEEKYDLHSYCMLFKKNLFPCLWMTHFRTITLDSHSNTDHSSIYVLCKWYPKVVMKINTIGLYVPISNPKCIRMPHNIDSHIKQKESTSLEKTSISFYFSSGRKDNNRSSEIVTLRSNGLEEQPSPQGAV